MKIPQREDIVQLGAPQTDGGRVAMPSGENLGNSYIKTVQGLAGSLRELSKLNQDLALNSMKLNVDRFNAYAKVETKKYLNALSLEKNIDNFPRLYEEYKANLEETGNKMLGSDFYQGWFDREGGALIADAEYSTELQRTKLQIEDAKNNLNVLSREYNTLAMTADSEEERKQYITDYHNIVTTSQANGTISKAEADDYKYKFNHDFDLSLVAQEINQDPKKIAKELRGNPEYAPTLTADERLRFAIEAEKLAERRKGTKAAKVAKLGIEYWTNMYFSRKPEEQDWAYRTYAVYASNLKDAKEQLAKDLRMDIKDITYQDVENIRSHMQNIIKFNDQDRVRNYETAKTANELKFNQLTTIKTKNSKGEIDFKNPTGVELLYAFEKGKLKDTLSNSSQIVDLFNSFNALQVNKETRPLAFISNEERASIDNKKMALAQLYVKGISTAEDYMNNEEGWSSNMKDTLVNLYDKVESVSGGDAEKRMSTFVYNLMSHADVKELFDNSIKKDKDTQEQELLIVRNALSNAGISPDFVQYMFEAPSVQKKKSLWRRSYEAGKEISKDWKGINIYSGGAIK